MTVPCEVAGQHKHAHQRRAMPAVGLNRPTAWDEGSTMRGGGLLNHGLQQGEQHMVRSGDEYAPLVTHHGDTVPGPTQ